MGGPERGHAFVGNCQLCRRKVALGGLYEFNSHQSKMIAQQVLENGCNLDHCND